MPEVRRLFGMADLQDLPAFGPDGTVNVMVEAPRGATAKCKHDGELGLFVFGRPLPRGLHYPYDWGFIPSTRGEDGDPLDAMVLHDAACPVGCLLRCEPVAVLQVEQREEGKTRRNDRLLFRPAADATAKEQQLLVPRLKQELEQFFQAAILGTGKTLTFKGWAGADQVIPAIRKALRPAGRA